MIETSKRSRSTVTRDATRGTFTVTTSVRFTDAEASTMYEDSRDVIGPGISYWGGRVYTDPVFPDCYRVEGPMGNGGMIDTRVTVPSLLRALADVASGAYTNERLAGYARKALADRDAGEIDTDLADVIVQVMLFDELVYG